MYPYVKLLIEAIVVGIFFAIVGIIASFIAKGFVPSAIAPEFKAACAVWNKYYVMEITLFLTGFLGHLICEAFGINAWYVINGAAAINMRS
jgi:hypothetical protein